MQTADDGALLRDYAENHSDAAFAALVTRYINLVYSVAIRQAGNPHQAEEITQAVFIILAKKALQLRHQRALSSWLFNTTRLTANNIARSEARRHGREQEAFMQTVLDKSGEDIWPRIAPMLDHAVATLNEKDRRAIVLRFYEGRDLNEVALEMGVTGEAAKKRVARALERLQRFFSKRGVNSTTAAISETISAGSIQIAPAALAKSVVSAALAKGSGAAASTLALADTTMKTMTWLKLKWAAGLAVAVIVMGGAGFAVLSQGWKGDDLTPRQIARQSQNAYDALTSYRDTGTAIVEGAGTTENITFNIRLQRPGFYRVEWTTTGGFYSSKGVIWNDGSGNYFVMGAANQMDAAKPQKESSMQMAMGAATGVSGSAADAVPGTFFDLKWGGQLDLFSSPRVQTRRFPDETVAGVDCYVIGCTLGPVKLPHSNGTSGTTATELWIGRQDHLIRRIKTTIAGASVQMPIKDENLQTILAREGKAPTPEAIAALRAEMEKSTKAVAAAGIVFTQSHENISVNQKFSASDFAR